MPEEENKRISLIKFIWSRPEGQRLATAAMLVVLFLTTIITVVVHSYYGTLQKDIIKCDTGYKILEKTVDSLKNDALKKSEDTNKRLQARLLWEDSVKQTLQILLNNKK